MSQQMPAFPPSLESAGAFPSTPTYAVPPDLLVRDVEAVAPAKPRSRSYGSPRRPRGSRSQELADAMILVDESSPSAARRTTERAADCGSERGAVCEDLRVGAERSEDRARRSHAGRAHGEEDFSLCWDLVAGLDDPCLGPAELPSVRSVAAVREGRRSALPHADEGAKLVLASDSPRAAIEAAALRTRGLAEAGGRARRRPSGSELLAELFLPHLAHLIGLPDEQARSVRSGPDRPGVGSSAS